MRVILIKQASDLQALTTRLVGKKPGSSATLDRVKALNPHVDFNRIEAGTVLLLPDASDIKADDKDSRSLAGDAFDDIVRHAEEGLKATAGRVRKAADELAADRAAIAAVIKTAAVKRLIESDPLLKKQLEDAGEASTAAQKNVQEAAKQVQAMQKMVDEELAALRQLLD